MKAHSLALGVLNTPAELPRTVPAGLARRSLTVVGRVCTVPETRSRGKMKGGSESRDQKRRFMT